MSFKMEAILPQAGKVEIEYQWDSGDRSVGINPGLEILAIRRDGGDILGGGQMTAEDEAAADEAVSKDFERLMGDERDDEYDGEPEDDEDEEPEDE